jgi:molybdopterin molybdotransferase
MISLEAALERMLAGVTPLPAEQVALDDALGRVLAEPVVSRLTLPPWDNSAMDGFAVRAADVDGASRKSPRVLRLVGESAAGHASESTVEPGTAVHILTGAPLPAGADAVVPVEATSAYERSNTAPQGAADDAGSVEVYQPTTVGAHIRRTGSDVRVGYPLLDAGQPLTPVALAVAAAGGHATLPVHLLPRVAVLATGDELVAPGAELGPAQIPDSNSVGLLGQAREVGAEVRGLGIAADTTDDVLRRLRPALEWADVVVVSGGVSVGTHDVVKEALATVGELDLWRVAVQPGKPLAFARAARSTDADSDGGRPGQVLIFGLPGNPVSSFVTFELFVRPVLRRLAGCSDLYGREVVHARLTEPVSKSHGRRAFLRVRLAADERTGGWRASLAGGQGSHVLSALAAADGLAVIPEDHDTLAAGAEVDVIRLRIGGQS